MHGIGHLSLLSLDGPLISSQPTVSSIASLVTSSLTSPPSPSGSLPSLFSSPDASPVLIGVPLVVIPTTQGSPLEAPPLLESPFPRHPSPFARSFVAVPPIYATISPSPRAASSSSGTYSTTPISEQALLFLQSQALRGLGSELAPTYVPPQSLIYDIAAFSTQSSPTPSVTTIQDPRAANPYIVPTTSDQSISSSAVPASTTFSSWSAASSVASPTSSYEYVTGVRLAHPTPIIAQAVNDSHYDDASATIAPGLDVQLFGQRSTSFTVTTNGVCVHLKCATIRTDCW